jgi:iron complex outermembrane receptor protein
VRASYGTFDTIDVKAAFGGKLTDTISARLSGVIQTRSDWIDNKHTGEDDALGSDETGALRLQFLFEPTENFSALLNLHAWEVDGTARVFRANIIKPGTNDLVSDFEQDEVFHDGQNFQDIDSQGASLRFDYDLGGSVLTSITSFETLDMLSGADIDGGFGASFAPPFGPGFIPFYSETADGIPDLDQFTQEIRIASEGEQRFGWLVGAFYFDEDLSAETFSFTSIAPGNPVEGFATQEQQAESYALFGSINYLPNDRWDLGAGIRFSTDEKDFAAERPDPVFPSLTPTIRPVTAHTDEDNVSWDVSAKYQVTDQTNVYGRIATSFRAPSIQGRILFAPDAEFGLNPATNGLSVADEEEILSFEIGTKTELLNRKLRLGIGVFQYEVDGQQITAVGGAFNVNTLLNADTEGYGFEADVEWAPTAAFQVTLGVSNNQTEIKDRVTVAPCGIGQCTVTDPLVGGLALIEGNSLPHAPEWIFNGIIDYRKPAGQGIFVGSIDWAYGDERNFFLYESKEYNADSFELGARIGFTFAKARYEVAAYARNLTDEEIIQGGIDFNNLTGMMNDPRTVGIELLGRW